MGVPPMVSNVAAASSQAVDMVEPGLIDGFHLTGSVAVGDFQAGRGLARLGPSGASASDIDFVAVTARPRAAHRSMIKLSDATGITVAPPDRAVDLQCACSSGGAGSTLTPATTSG